MADQNSRTATPKSSQQESLEGLAVDAASLLNKINGILVAFAYPSTFHKPSTVEVVAVLDELNVFYSRLHGVIARGKEDPSR